MDIEIDDDEVIVVPSAKEDEYFRQLSREYTVPCAYCDPRNCFGNCDTLIEWRRKMLGLDKDTAGGHSNNRRRKR